jgi:phosphatidate cytidylyltransferase
VSDDARGDKPQRDPSEGVRLIGADEAAEAVERGDVSQRLPDAEPRFGDRPPAPDGPRPALRFPLTEADDAATFVRPAPVPVQPRTEAPELSHWAGSAAEEVPNMSRRDPLEGDDQGWSSFSGLGPRWRDDVPPVEPPRRPADQWAPPDPAAPVYEGEVPAPPPGGRSVFGDAPPAPTYDDDVYADDTYDDDPYSDVYADEYEGDEYYPDQSTRAAPDEGAWAGGPPPGAPAGAGVAAGAAAFDEAGRPRRDPRRGGGAPRRARKGSDRDLRTAIGVGVVMVAVALALLHFVGPLGGMILVVPIVGYATYEFLTSADKAGFEPPVWVGVASAVGTAIAAYNYGEAAIPLAFVLTVAVLFLWYLIGAGDQQPAANIGVTLLGAVWIGLFGSFAALLLSIPTYGVGFLLVAVIPTVAYDVGGLFVGRSAGSRALSSASPNKTIEGLAGGMFLALVTGAAFGGFGMAPFDGWGDGLLIGLVVALAAPIGDLAESLLKRDLDLKDMGSILPGHGGLLDRFDAVLFVLPAIWYLARVQDFFVL